MKITIISPDGVSKNFQVEADRAVVGRRESCEVQLHGENISREHLEILAQDDAIVVKDLTKSNWVSFNDEKLSKTDYQKYFDFTTLMLPGGFKIEIELGRTFDVDDEYLNGNKTTTKTSILKSKRVSTKSIKISKKPSGELRSGRRVKTKGGNNLKSKDKKKDLIIMGLIALVLGAIIYFLM